MRVVGPYIQRGRGLGSIFSSLFNAAIPALKSIGGTLGSLGKQFVKSDAVKNVGKTIAEAALQGGLSLAADAVKGKNIAESAKSNLVSSRDAVSEAISNELDKRRIKVPIKRKAEKKKKKKKRVVVIAKRTKKRPDRDIFEDVSSDEYEYE